MSKINSFFIVLFLLFLSQLTFALGNRENNNEPVSTNLINQRTQGQVVQVTGIVRLVGSSPMNEIVITGFYSIDYLINFSDENQRINWYIARDEMNKLYDLQHRTVTIEGEETTRELTFASGFSAGTRRELGNITVISIE